MKPRPVLLHIILPTLLAGLLGSCEDQDPATNRATLWLTDTLGHEQTTFRSGEDFIAHMVWLYDSTAAPDGLFAMPAVDCGIWLGDSLVAAATWGCVYLMPATTIEFDHLDSLQLHWRGPRGQCQDDPVILPPGSYEARAIFSPLFETNPPPQALPVTFTVQP